MILLFGAYSFWRMWHDLGLRSVHWAMAFAVGVLAFLGVLALAGLFMRRWSKCTDAKVTLHL